MEPITPAVIVSPGPGGVIDGSNVIPPTSDSEVSFFVLAPVRKTYVQFPSNKSSLDGAYWETVEHHFLAATGLY